MVLYLFYKQARQFPARGCLALTPPPSPLPSQVYFLKQLDHARAIRNRLLECFERASVPQKSEAEMQRLLTFVVVGGGPTSVEFSAELYDFIRSDVSKWYHLLSASLPA